MTDRICAHTGSRLIPLSGPLEHFSISPEGVVYSERAHSVDYGPDYFLSEYQAQYGRSYLEDEHSLRNLARRRLTFLEPVCPPPATLLEIGCAAGFFLDEARRAGYQVTGVEISEFGYNHATKKLGLDVHLGPFPAACPLIEFDCVAAFYVLEHFADQGALFREVSRRIRAGGALLASLPSTHGPLFTTDSGRWAQTHPIDHFVDYSPESLNRILPLYGLESVRARPASYHPDRMRHRRYRRWFPALYRRWADRNVFGDTLEFVARSTKKEQV